MKKSLSLLAAALLGILLAAPAFAIEDPDPKGTMTVGLQLGPRTGACVDFDITLDEYLNFDINTTGGFMLGVEPVLTADYVLVDSWWKGHFTVGAMLGGYRIGTTGEGTKIYHSAFVVTPRAMYGLNLSKKFEVHAGVGLGVAFRSCSAHVEEDMGAAFVSNYITGVRFKLNPKFALTADINLSAYMPLISLGAAFKF